MVFKLLKYRMQIVILNDVLGNKIEFNCSVPQGSIFNICFLNYRYKFPFDEIQIANNLFNSNGCKIKRVT